MVAGGLIDETRTLLPRLGPQAREALGYKQIVAWIEAGAPPGSVEEVTERIKIETRRFAKSQRTWLRRLRTFSHAVWLKPAEQDLGEMAQIVVEQCLRPI